MNPKVIKAVLVLLAAVLVLAIVGVIANANGLLGRGIEVAVNEGGPRVTSTAVRLDKAHVSLFQGQAKLEQFGIANPEGFTEAEAISFGAVELEIEPMSVFSDKVIVKRVALTQPSFRFEQTMKGNNLQTLQRAVQENLGSGETPNEPAKEGGKKVVIQEIVLREATVEAHILGKSTSFTLDEIVLQGDAEQGVTPQVALGQVLERILPAVIKGIAEQAKDLAGVDAEGILEDVQTESTEALEDAKSKAEEAVRGTLGGFLGGNEE